MKKGQSATLTHNPILWGAYLACSWTWCIGMFLPTLLLRDMGWPGFLIFALPNVIGAAAMGWIIKSRIDSEHFVEKHPVAVWWFSTVTLAFHLFWIFWISHFIRMAFPISTGLFMGVISIGIVFAILLGKTFRLGKAPQLAVLLLIVSLGVLISTFFTPVAKEVNNECFNAVLSTKAPLWMLPVMIFGFLLCPYLDITFHHARQQLGRRKNGRIGFAIGFVAFFSFMILLTTRYAHVMVSALDGTGVVARVSPWIAAGILIHIFCQWIFTVGVHLDRMRTLPKAKAKQPLLLACLLLAGLAGFFSIHLSAYAGLTGGEIIYRSFMSAYGLVFPAYILYRVVMARNGKSPLSLIFMGIAIAIASPLFWLGFMERQTFWLIPGMAVILLGAVIAGSKSAPVDPAA
jgi:hypothetical protein